MSTPVTTSLNPWGKPISRASLVRSHQKGRICAHEGCDTILSIYNPARYCAAHLKEAQGKRRTKPTGESPSLGKRPYGGETQVVQATGVLTVSGEMDQHTTSRFKSDVDDAIGLTSGDLILDLSDLDSIDSAALSVMFGALQRLSGEGRRIILVVTPGPVMRVLRITGLDTVFLITGNRRQALQLSVARV